MNPITAVFLLMIALLLLSFILIINSAIEKHDIKKTFRRHFGRNHKGANPPPEKYDIGS